MGTILSGRTYWRSFDAPFFSGTQASVSASAVSKYDVVLGGRGYLVDLDGTFSGEKYRFESIPMLHAMFLQDRGTIPIGEHSLNPMDYWRRSVDDWSAGAGQTVLDLSTSVDNRFRISKGVDPWTIGELDLLHDTTKLSARVPATTALLRLLVAGAYLYVIADDVLSYGDTASQTTVTAAGGDSALSAVTDITTDAYTVWIADANRVHYTTRAGATFAKYHATDHKPTLLRSAKGRLFSAIGNVLYTHSGAAGSAVATAYFTHPNLDWTWTAVAGGPDAVYFAGYSGSHSAVYAATIKSDGTALDVPVSVLTLPSGETARSLHAYLTALLIGTDKGLRMAIIGTSGSLTLGGLITLAQPPQCFESQDRFVWFGWTDYDAISTGLGRVDLSVFNGDVPAYATDLMALGAGTVTSVVTFGGGRVFSVSGGGSQSQTVAVGASNDDAVDLGTGASIPDAQMDLTGGSGIIGLRFAGLTVPQGATVTSATLSIAAALGLDDIEVAIVGGALDNAAVFTPTENLFGIPQTGAAVGWSATLTDGYMNVSPDLSAIFTEIFARAGWASGNAASLLLIDLGTSSLAVDSFDAGNPALYPTLHVTYITGGGIYKESTDNVTSGTIKSGWLNYALADNKLAIKAAVSTRIGAGSYRLDLARDDLPALSVGNVIDTSDTIGASEVIALPELQGRTFEVGFTVNRSATDHTKGPRLDRWTLMVEPQPERRARFMVPILLHSQQKDRLQSTIFYDAAAERRRFFDLMVSREIIPLQDREQTYNVIVDDLTWIPYEQVGASRQQGSWDGTLALTCKVIN